MSNAVHSPQSVEVMEGDSNEINWSFAFIPVEKLVAIVWLLGRLLAHLMDGALLSTWGEWVIFFTICS